MSIVSFKTLRPSRSLSLILGLILAVSATPSALSAQAAEPWEAGCLISGLDPNGDGFLSIRAGPASSYSEIARVRNGDALFLDMRQCQGNWCYAQGAVVNDVSTDLIGWFYNAWCEFYP